MQAAKPTAARLSTTLTLRREPVRVEEDEQTDGAVALVIEFVVLELAGFDRNRSERARRWAVFRQSRPPGASDRAFGIKIEHILHGHDELAIRPVECTPCPCARDRVRSSRRNEIS